MVAYAYKIDYVNYTEWIIVEKSLLSTALRSNLLLVRGLSREPDKLDEVGRQRQQPYLAATVCQA